MTFSYLLFFIMKLWMVDLKLQSQEKSTEAKNHDWQTLATLSHCLLQQDRSSPMDGNTDRLRFKAMLIISFTFYNTKNKNRYAKNIKNGCLKRVSYLNVPGIWTTGRSFGSRKNGCLVGWESPSETRSPWNQRKKARLDSTGPQTIF